MKNYTGPMRFCHRGVAQAAPENTLGAFQAAIDEGYEAVELDIRMSKDGEVIVCHDHHFARLTCGHPTKFCIDHLEDMTWEELSQLELPYVNHLMDVELTKYSEDEGMLIQPWKYFGDYKEGLKRDPRMGKLMRFVDFDNWMSTLDKKITVEVEFCVPGMMPRVMEILQSSPNCENYILFTGHCKLSSHYHILEEIQDTIKAQGKPKGLRLGANIRQLTDDYKAYIKDMDLFEVGLNDWKYTKDDVKYLNDRGIQVLSNLGDYPRWWEEVCTNGSLGFKTDYPAAFTKWWHENH